MSISYIIILSNPRLIFSKSIYWTSCPLSNTLIISSLSSITQSNKSIRANKLLLNILASNYRSFSSKKRSIEQILIENSVDIAIVSELNMKTIPKVQGSSNRKFHGTAIFCQNYLQGQVIRIPDEDEIELIHILIKTTTPMLNVIGVYLDCERRDNDVDKSTRIIN